MYVETSSGALMLWFSLNIETSNALADVKLVTSLPVRVSASQYAYSSSI
jgi:hypothetical protein